MSPIIVNRRVARAFLQYGFGGPQPASCYIPQYGQSSCEGIFDLPGPNELARAKWSCPGQMNSARPFLSCPGQMDLPGRIVRVRVRVARALSGDGVMGRNALTSIPITTGIAFRYVCRPL